MDTVTREKRSEIMARIRSRDTVPELAMARALRKVGASGWRRCRRIGRIATPDFIWRREMVALFVHGCWWHGCARCYRAPKSNCHFWRAKVERNRQRDVRQAEQLRAAGWTVLVAWECWFKQKSLGSVATLVRSYLESKRRALREGVA